MLALPYGGQANRTFLGNVVLQHHTHAHGGNLHSPAPPVQQQATAAAAAAAQSAAAISASFPARVSHRQAEEREEVLRRHLREERQEYLERLRQWELERSELRREIQTKDAVIMQLEEELLQRPSQRDFALLQAELRRARREGFMVSSATDGIEALAMDQGDAGEGNHAGHGQLAGLNQSFGDGYGLKGSAGGRAGAGGLPLALTTDANLDEGFVGGKMWKSRDPRSMMDADRRIHFVNKRRRAQGLGSLEDCEHLELRRFAAGVLSTLRLVDVQQAERSVGELCKLVEKTVPGLKWFAEEVGYVCSQGIDDAELEVEKQERAKEMGSKKKNGAAAGMEFDDDDWDAGSELAATTRAKVRAADATSSLDEREMMIRRVKRWKKEAREVREWRAFYGGKFSVLK